MQCDSSSDAMWFRSKSVAFRHVDTGKFLVTSSAHQFNQQNCGGNCPIMSQTEVSAGARKDSKAKWATGQGVYFPPHSAGGSAEEEDDEL